jgi:hypothetical protein
MEAKGSQSFQSMEALLREWLADARLVEIVHVVQLAKSELILRGIMLTWSIDQAAVVEDRKAPGRAGEPRGPATPWRGPAGLSLPRS